MLANLGFRACMRMCVVERFARAWYVKSSVTSVVQCAQVYIQTLTYVL
jgi:hypothetical protein